MKEEIISDCSLNRVIYHITSLSVNERLHQLQRKANYILTEIYEYTFKTSSFNIL